MEEFRFLSWKVYQDAKGLFSSVLKFVKKLPNEYRFELGNQVIRSSLSVVLNIAEGSGKFSDKELNRFLNISLGSLNETLAVFDVLQHNKFITSGEFDDTKNKIIDISRQIGGFKKKLSKL